MTPRIVFGKVTLGQLLTFWYLWLKISKRKSGKLYGALGSARDELELIASKWAMLINAPRARPLKDALVRAFAI